MKKTIALFLFLCFAAPASAQRLALARDEGLVAYADSPARIDEP